VSVLVDLFDKFKLAVRFRTWLDSEDRNPDSAIDKIGVCVPQRHA